MSLNRPNVQFHMQEMFVHKKDCGEPSSSTEIRCMLCWNLIAEVRRTNINLNICGKWHQEMNYAMRDCKLLFLSLFLAVLTGCASTGKNPQDPLEGYNRAMLGFNDKVDQIVLKPTAKAYKAVTPSIIRTGIGNFFANIHDIPTALNNVLQARIKDAVSDIGRVFVNTFF